MKLTKKKIDKIQDVCNKLFDYGLQQYHHIKIARNAVNKIIEIHDNKKSRSLPELRLYWACCSWVSYNFPEWAESALNTKVNSELIHVLTKTKFGITSAAFDALPESEFNEYFENALNWWAVFFIRCDVKDIIDQSKNIMDEVKR